jgi:hypothetical protein
MVHGNSLSLPSASFSLSLGLQPNYLQNFQDLALEIMGRDNMIMSLFYPRYVPRNKIPFLFSWKHRCCHFILFFTFLAFLGSLSTFVLLSQQKQFWDPGPDPDLFIGSGIFTTRSRSAFDQLFILQKAGFEDSRGKNINYWIFYLFSNFSEAPLILRYNYYFGAVNVLC